MKNQVFDKYDCILHTCLNPLVVDATETCDGSSRLMRLLNSLGVCVRADTHAHCVQYRIHKSKICNVPSGTFQDPDTAATEVDEGGESGSDVDNYLERS